MSKIFIGLFLGGGAGFVYHRLIGCRGGACPILRNPYASMFYGALLGALILFSFRK